MKFGLIGYPLTHSSSREYFKEKFISQGLKGFSYDNFSLADIDAAGLLLQGDFLGFNVTIPYKERIIPFLDELDPVAEAIGAVNTIVHTDIGAWKGYNTDATGFQESLIHWFGDNPFPENALVLGTGGASKAITFVLQQVGIKPARVSRHFKGDYTYAELNRQIMEDYSLIVNTTPLGMFPQTDLFPDIPYGALNSNHWMYDLIYNPGNTLFLTRGEQAGARVKNGLDMLHLQADHAWAIWKKYGKF